MSCEGGCSCSWAWQPGQPCSSLRAGACCAVAYLEDGAVLCSGLIRSVAIPDVMVWRGKLAQRSTLSRRQRRL